MSQVNRMLLSIVSFWVGGAFTVAVTIIDSTGTLPLTGVLQAAFWPASFLHWILY